VNTADHKLVGKQKGATGGGRAHVTPKGERYGFFFVVSFFVVSIVILLLSIFIPVSAGAADGAGAIAGGVVSFAALSDFEHAATIASTAATTARRFMTIS
jgi:hypothetical protein